MEGCYIPGDWRKNFGEEYLPHIRYVCLVMTESYIREHFDDIRANACVIEDRGEDEDCTQDGQLADNRAALERCREQRLPYILIDGPYTQAIESFFGWGSWKMTEFLRIARKLALIREALLKSPGPEEEIDVDLSGPCGEP